MRGRDSITAAAPFAQARMPNSAARKGFSTNGFREPEPEFGLPSSDFQSEAALSYGIPQ